MPKTPRIARSLAFLAAALLAHAGDASGQTVTRGPYLQVGTPDGVVVRWRTDVPTSSAVYCGTIQGNLTPCASDGGSATEHVLPVDLLAPGTRYFYGVGSTTQILAGDDPLHFFDTAPPVGTPKSTRIWVLGDSGTGDANAASVRDAYYGFTGARHTDLWLMLGDNAYPEGTDAEYQSALFDMYPDMLRKSVLWPTLGNHDGPDPATQAWPYFDNFTLPTGGEAGGLASGSAAYYAFDFANIHFVVLDSQASDRSPGSTMLTWLAADLASTSQEWIVAFWHHPPYSKGRHDSDNPDGQTETRLQEMRENAVPILEAWGVDLVLAGHSHSYERSYLIDGFHLTPTTPLDGTILDAGDGDELGSGAYQKPQRGAVPYPAGAGDGAVYTVAGSSGKLTPGVAESLGGPIGGQDHPVMRVGLYELGSVVLDVLGNRLDAAFLDSSGSRLDVWTIVKDCVADADGDGVCDDRDNCQSTGNPEQTDDDGDGQGSACDPCPLDALDDADADGFCADADNCPVLPNDQTDTDGDGAGDACDGDDDDDGVDDGADCAPLVRAVSAAAGPVGDSLRLERMPDVRLVWKRGFQGHTSNVRSSVDAAGTFDCLVSQTPKIQVTDASATPPGSIVYYLLSAENLCGEGPVALDSQGAPRSIAAPCAPPGGVDHDSDGWIDLADNCPLEPNPSQADDDRDYVGNTCDTCTGVFDPDQDDCDRDGEGDACDLDSDCDGDASPNLADNCPYTPNPGQADSDGDGPGDGCDNCPGIFNPGQTDSDRDGLGDVCDACTDIDVDTFGNPGFPASTCPLDNCPATTNHDQADADGDGHGDVCDGCPLDALDDGDGDGLCAEADNCPAIANATQDDLDGDAIGDACDACTDTDGDGFGNPGFPANTCGLDNCPDDVDPSQKDEDGDAIGDVCDDCPSDPLNDPDGDSICNTLDNCPTVWNRFQEDLDLDGLGDVCDDCTDPDGDGRGSPGFPNLCETDNCPDDPNPDQADADLDGLGDVCDDCTDPDGDGRGSPGFPNLCETDNCPDDPNPDQADADLDGLGDVCDDCPGDPLDDPDGDGDQIGDVCDNCPFTKNITQSDTDFDGVGNACDNCPDDPNPDQADADLDGLGDACDPIP